MTSRIIAEDMYVLLCMKDEDKIDWIILNR